MNIIKYPKRSEWSVIVERPHLDVSQLNATVQSVLEKIKSEGDAAVIEFESKFDHVNLKSLSVSKEEMNEAENLISDELYHALILAHHNIAVFHESQKFDSSKIEIYPNPTSGIINIKGLDKESIKAIGIYNLLGDFITSELNINSVQTGIYILKITTDNTTFYKRIIKK